MLGIKFKHLAGNMLHCIWQPEFIMPFISLLQNYTQPDKTRGVIYSEFQ